MIDDLDIFPTESNALDNTLLNSSEIQDDVELDVRPNDSKVLEMLSENNSKYTFKGLMRKLDMHQETLSRSLQRLHDLDLVEKSNLGYKLSQKGAFLIKESEVPKAKQTQLLQTYIPSNITANDIINKMAGKWFKNLRWIGMVEEPTEHLLQWTSELDSFQINLRILPNQIIIETSAENADKSKVMISAYRILKELSNVYSYHDINSPANFSNKN